MIIPADLFVDRIEIRTGGDQKRTVRFREVDIENQNERSRSYLWVFDGDNDENRQREFGSLMICVLLRGACDKFTRFSPHCDTDES